MQRWYRINTHEITDSHNITICNDKTVHMLQLPPAEPNEANAIETFARLSTPSSQPNIDLLTNRQPITNSHNNNESSALLPDIQSNTILHQFSMMAEELKYFAKQVSNNITEMTQTHNTPQEHTGKLIKMQYQKHCQRHRIQLHHYPPQYMQVLET